MSQRKAGRGARAALYVRVSHREQETLTDQERRCRAFAESKGWEVAEVYSDHGISAWSGADRPAWLRLEQAVDRREVDAVVVFQVSRAARNVGRLARFIELCRDREVVFASTSEGVDTSTPMGRLMATIVGALAELESEIRSERVLLGLDRVRAEGRWTGGRVPYGFRQEDGSLVPDPDEGRRVREAASRFLAGQGLQTIAKDWNASGVATKRGGRWSATTIKDILRYPGHEGVTLTHRDRERVVARLETQRESSTPRGARYLLTGLLRCGVCDEPMVGQPRRGVRRYRCRHPHDVVIRAEVVEGVVTRRAADATLETEGVADPGAAPKELAAALEAAEESLREAARTAAETGVDPGALRAYLEPLTARRDAAGRELEEATTRLGTPSWTELLDTAVEPTPEEWRGIVEEVVDHVRIGPRKADGVRAPSESARVVIVWRQGVRVKEPRGYRFGAGGEGHSHRCPAPR